MEQAGGSGSGEHQSQHSPVAVECSGECSMVGGMIALLLSLALSLLAMASKQVYWLHCDWKPLSVLFVRSESNFPMVHSQRLPAT